MKMGLFFRVWILRMLLAELLACIIVLLLIFGVSPSRAGDVNAPAIKAPALQSVFNGYPYGSSGLFFGVFTEGGGGPVTANVPGIGSASLTSTSGGIGGTIGYAWGAKNSQVAFSLEGDFGFNNFNGNTPGLSMSGPLSFEQRFVAFTPLASLLSLLPNFPSLGTIAPFPSLQPGLTASNLQMGLFAGVRETDISPNFVGLPANREYRIAPVIGIMAMEQLSNGSAMRAWVKTVFPDKGICAGPVANACENTGQQVLAGVGVYF